MKHSKFNVVSVITKLVIILYLLNNLIPIVWTFKTSLKLPRDIASSTPVIFFETTGQHYLRLFREINILPVVFHSLQITLLTSFTAMLFGLMGAYAFARFKSWQARSMGMLSIGLRLFPAITIILPIFLLFRQIGLTNTVFGVVLANQGWALPMSIYILWSFIKQTPIDLEEAAWMDGCSRFSGIIKIVLPAISPGLISTFILITIFSWNEFFVPLIIGSGRHSVITMHVTRYLGGLDYGVQWGALSALATIIMVPVLIVAIFASRYLILVLGGSDSKKVV